MLPSSPMPHGDVRNINSDVGYITSCHLPYPHADVRNIILAWVGVMISNTLKAQIGVTSMAMQVSLLTT